MLAQQDAAFLILASDRQKFSCDPVQDAFVGNAEPVGCEGGRHKHTGKMGPKASEAQSDCFVELQDWM